MFGTDATNMEKPFLGFMVGLTDVSFSGRTPFRPLLKDIHKK